MKNLVIDTPATAILDAPPHRRAGLGKDIVHVVIDSRKLPDSLPSFEQSFPIVPIGRSSGSRIYKDYVVSCDPYKIKPC